MRTRRTSTSSGRRRVVACWVAVALARALAVQQGAPAQWFGGERRARGWSLGRRAVVLPLFNHNHHWQLSASPTVHSCLLSPGRAAPSRPSNTAPRPSPRRRRLSFNVIMARDANRRHPCAECTKTFSTDNTCSATGRSTTPSRDSVSPRPSSRSLADARAHARACAQTQPTRGTRRVFSSSKRRPERVLSARTTTRTSVPVRLRFSPASCAPLPARD